MKALGVLVGLAIVAAAGFLLWPRLNPSHAPAAPAVRSPLEPGTGTSRSTEAPRPDRPLEAPLNREEELRQQFSEKRIPFYRFLRKNYADVIDRFAVTEDLDALDVVVHKTDDDTLRYVVENAVGPNAKEYGFRKVRFYVANPRGSVEPVTLIAESTVDGTGRWNTFRK